MYPQNIQPPMPVKPVKIKRIGYLSMGVILVLLGVSMMVALFNNPDAVRIIMKLWPLCLVIYGAEILFYTIVYRNREDTLIKFDFLSVIILVIIVGAAFTAFGCTLFTDYAVQNGYHFMW